MPPFERSEWRDCHAVNAAGGLEMMEWQDGIMEGWLGTNRLGRWSAQTCAGCVPRQNGKTLGLVEARINYGMLMLGEEVIYTSHLQKTSTETFEGIAAFFDTKALRKHVKDVKSALGREEVRLKNGARIKFLARTRNGGRGQHGDLLVFDEALELDADQQASFLPAISATRNPQAVYVSTPPTAASKGEVFRNIRERALSGESERTAWFEWGVDEVGDVADKARWYETNPSLGVLIQEDAVEGECEQMDADTFARERLGWWSPVAQAEPPAIDPKDWAALATDDPPREGGRVAYAFKFAPDGSTVALAACRRPDEGLPHVEAVDCRSLAHGAGWCADFAEERKATAACFVVDGGGSARALHDELLRRKVPKGAVVEPAARDVAAACSMLVAGVADGTFTHFGQPGLDECMANVRKRLIGSTGFGFEGIGGADPTMAEAVALALWGAMTAKRDPRKKGRAGC